MLAAAGGRVEASKQTAKIYETSGTAAGQGRAGLWLLLWRVPSTWQFRHGRRVEQIYCPTLRFCSLAPERWRDTLEARGWRQSTSRWRICCATLKTTGLLPEAWVPTQGVRGDRAAGGRLQMGWPALERQTA